ncbi:unnamed protein product [Adineta ricciae]|uniref:Doublecortin domain-containing protein n=1 Tax=Adineta ricciae TaxID=249248 RepID=A0A814YRY5_ADIRI|nr:unnamed protein product [Adineta ricciae]CAF1232519.1 unnamed protein product [Adineta ricciae]
MLPTVSRADPKLSTRLSPILSYNGFEQDNGNQAETFANQQFFITNSSSVQRRDQQSFPTSRQIDSPLAILTFCPIKDSIAKFFTEKDEPKASDDEQLATSSSSTSLVLTTNRAQQTSPTDMFPIVNNTTVDNNHYLQRQGVLQRNHSENSVTKQTSSDEQSSTIINDDEDESLHTSKIPKSTHRSKQTPRIKYSENNPSPAGRNGKSSANNWQSTSNTPRTYPVVPSITQRPIQGILVQFVRSGESHHRGVRIAVNEFDLKSWEAFLNYLNRQPNLALSTGGIRHIYSLTGEEILSTNQFQHRQSYIVSSGSFVRTNYRYITESFADEPDLTANSSVQPGPSPYWNTRSSVHPRWRSPAIPGSSLSTTNGEQIFLLPYSKLNLYESIILNRNLTQTFEEWLQDQVTDVLCQHTNNDSITNLFAVLNSAFIEVKSFSKLFALVKKTDTFIGCTEGEYTRAKDYLEMIKPSELFVDRKWSSQQSNTRKTKQRFPSKRIIDEIRPSITWIHGYNGDNELTKKLYSLPENEILYVIDSICVVYEPNLKQQRFYTKHKHLITCVNVHRSQTLVASSEKGSSKTNQRALIHIWDHTKLETVREIQKDQFGSFISLLSFSPKPDDDLLLVISRDKPKLVLFIDWKRNELIYSITCKSDNILSVLFVFGSTEWIACISQRHLLFYHINWSLRPLKMLERRESEVQNIYTGAAACDMSGEQLLVGDEVGNVYIWGLIDREPKLIVVQECILENDVDLIIPVNHETFLLANRENQVKLWNLKSDTVEQIRVNENIGTIQSACCIQRESVCVGLAIGTKSNYIISKEMGKDQFHVLMRGHTSPSISICCGRDDHYYFSISSDRNLFKWNMATKSVEWSTKSTQPISCADIHPQRNVIVLGTETSKLIIYDTLSSFYITTITLKFNTGVKSVRFSPDGLSLAVGLHNGNVCIFDVLGNGDFHQHPDGLLQNDTAAVSTVIWSVDGKYLLVVYSDNDYNIWTIPAFEINRGKKIESIEWDRIVHPLMCHLLDKTIIDAHASAVILSANLVLCCGKDGQLHLFRNRYEHNSQAFHFGLGPIQSIISSPTNNSYLVSLANNSAIVEIQIDIQNQL